MWFDDEFVRVRKHGSNRRRRTRRQPVLMVNARVSKQRRERLQHVGGLVVCAVAFAGVLWALMLGVRFAGHQLFSSNQEFTIRHIKVDLPVGGKLKPWIVKDHGEVAEGMNLFEIPLNTIRTNLEAVSLVKTAQVSRHLPDTLYVTLTERIPIANLGRNSRRNHLALDREGYLLPRSRSEHLPTIHGYDPPSFWGDKYVSDPTVRDALEVVDACDSTKLGEFIKLSRIDVSHDTHLDMYLADGARVLLPRQRVMPKLRKLAAIVQVSNEQGKQLASVDLTMDDNVPVQYR